MADVRALDDAHRSWDPDALFATIGRPVSRCASCRAEKAAKRSEIEHRLDALLARRGAMLAAAAAEAVRDVELDLLDLQLVPELPPMA